MAHGSLRDDDCSPTSASAAIRLAHGRNVSFDGCKDVVDGLIRLIFAGGIIILDPDGSLPRLRIAETEDRPGEFLIHIGRVIEPDPDVEWRRGRPLRKIVSCAHLSLLRGRQYR